MVPNRFIVHPSVANRGDARVDATFVLGTPVDVFFRGLLRIVPQNNS